MTELISDDLPLTIKISKELTVLFPQLPSVANKLEALFNFHTMTAGWYGDEEQVLTLNLQLEIPNKFEDIKQTLNENSTDIINYADDVMMAPGQTSLIYNIFIALTDGEQKVLIAQTKLLYSLTEIKLRKVLNLLAKEKSLTEI